MIHIYHDFSRHIHYNILVLVILYSFIFQRENLINIHVYFYIKIFNIEKYNQMNNIKNQISKYKTTKHLFTIQKKQKGKYLEFIAKDGFMLYKIDPIKTYCQCNQGNFLCYHLLNIYINHFKISNNLIHFINDLSKYLNDDYDDVNEYLLEKLKQEILNDNCCICMDALINDKFMRDSLYRCHSCKKYTHAYCYDLWSIRQKGCMYCRS